MVQVACLHIAAKLLVTREVAIRGQRQEVRLAVQCTITVTTAASGVTYELQTLGGASLTPVVSGVGAGANLSLTILQADAPVATTTYKVVASVGGCASVDLTDQPTVTVNNAPNAGLAVSEQPSDLLLPPAANCLPPTASLQLSATLAALSGSSSPKQRW